MKKINNGYVYFSIFIFLIYTYGCASTGTSILKLNYKPSENIRSTVSQTLKIKLIDFQDARDKLDKPELIGHREAAFGVSMGDVQVDRPISETINNAFRSELMHNGYKLVNTGEDFTIKGKILEFRVGTDVSTLYWDVYGVVKIVIEVNNTKNETVKFGPYSARNVERTYANPSVPIMERVILASIHEVIQKIIYDTEFAK